MSIDRDTLTKEGYQMIIDKLEGKKKYSGFFIFLFFALLGASASYIVCTWLQFLLLLLWGVHQTKLQIFVIVTFFILINSFKLTFSWKLR